MNIRRELLDWWHAALRNVPGRTGQWLRCRLSGYQCGLSSRVLSGVTVYHPNQLRIGDNVGIASSCQINAAGGVDIGNDVLIGPGTLVWSQNHAFRNANELIRRQGTQYAPVTIANDVWIAARCVILPGVTIAEGCVVAAGAVVTKSTQPYTIVAGVPAKAVGLRESQPIKTGGNSP